MPIFARAPHFPSSIAFSSSRFILLDELVQADIKLMTNGDGAPISGVPFPLSQRAMAGSESFRQGLLGELILLTNVFENLRDFHDDSLSFLMK